MTASGLSYTFHNGTGAQDTFAIGIDYISTDHLVLKIDDTVQVEAVDFNFVSTDVVFVPASIPASGTDNVQITRVTPREVSNRQVDFANNSGISESQLELMQKQMILMVQEALETNTSGQVTPGADFIGYDSVRALWLAKRTDVSTGLGGLVAPSSNDEAATKKYVDDIASFANSGVPQSWPFEGVTSQTNFTLSGGANLETEMVIVAVDGVLQAPLTAFNITKASPDSTLVFSASPADGAAITVMNFGKARFLSGAGLDDGSVATSKLADGAVTSLKIADGTIQDVDIAAAAITGAKIAALAIAETNLAVGAVAFAKMKAAAFATAPGGSVDQFLIVNKDTGNLTLGALDSYDIGDFASRLATIPLTSLAPPAGDLDIGNKRISNVTSPFLDGDATNKLFVDTQIAQANTSKIVLEYNVSNLAATTVITLDNMSWLKPEYYHYEFVLTCPWTIVPGDWWINFYQANAWSWDYRPTFVSTGGGPNVLKWIFVAPHSYDYPSLAFMTGASGHTITDSTGTPKPQVLGAMTNMKFTHKSTNGLTPTANLKIYGHKG